MLSLDDDDRGVANTRCGCCRRPLQRIWSTVLRQERPYALYYAYLFDHYRAGSETFLDVVFGVFGDEGEHVTFGCRYGAVSDSDRPEVTVVDAASAMPRQALYGRCLTRAEALEHPRLAEFGEVVDLLVEGDPYLRSHHWVHLPSVSVFLGAEFHSR